MGTTRASGMGSDVLSSATMFAAVALSLCACAMGGVASNDSDVRTRRLDAIEDYELTDDERDGAINVQPRADGALASSVDLRSQMSPVGYQDDRGTCAAFAATGLVEFFLNKRDGVSGAQGADLSEQMAIYDALRQQGETTRSDGGKPEWYRHVLTVDGLVTESTWPYEGRAWWDDSHEGCVDALSDGSVPVFCFTNGSPPESASGAERVRLADLKTLTASVDNVRAHLATNQTPVSAAFRTNLALWDHAYVTLVDGIDATSDGAHAVLIVGYDDALEADVPAVDSHGKSIEVHEKGFLIIRNSWSARWGESGYGYVSYAYAREQMIRAEVSTGLAR